MVQDLPFINGVPGVMPWEALWWVGLMMLLLLPLILRA